LASCHTFECIELPVANLHVKVKGRIEFEPSVGQFDTGNVADFQFDPGKLKLTVAKTNFPGILAFSGWKGYLRLGHIKLGLDIRIALFDHIRDRRRLGFDNRLSVLHRHGFHMRENSAVQHADQNLTFFNGIGT